MCLAGTLEMQQDKHNTGTKWVLHGVQASLVLTLRYWGVDGAYLLSLQEDVENSKAAPPTPANHSPHHLLLIGLTLFSPANQLTLT